MDRLETYMCQLLVCFINRMPIPLLVFLCLHEQSNIEFSNIETLKELTAINLKTATVTVP